MQVDGNVQRVMSRLLALRANPKAKVTLDILWTGASALVEAIGEL
jgi:A/G-specific adenine glycosylase